MANTNAFTMRRKHEKLREKYRTILAELAESADKKSNAYEDYLSKLDSILPRSEKAAVSAEILAAQLSNDEAEQESIRLSIRSFASNAELRRCMLKTEWELNATFPDLYTVKQSIIKHYAELDEDGNIIRKWNIETAEPRYYLKKEG